ncbi:hypothetical protein LTR85_010584 [Meristemomyces frigidus]|nr:hypothetical protein LTR85_010584 [Meristemomyces frigidus]
MADSSIPSQPPPTYNEATGSSSRPTASSSSDGHLGVPGASKQRIPMAHRRSMEDELRPLPKGWVRTLDPETQHQFFVDTTADPPRSIWTHPYDDEQYLRTLSGEERERVEQESLGRGRPPSKADIMAEHTDEDDDHHDHAGASASSSSHYAELPPRPDADKGKKAGFGRRMKDKMTGSTHEERVQERQKRAEEEQRAYEQHLKIRQAMAKAEQTGKPQLIGKDHQGKDIYIEPSSGRGDYPGGYGGGGYGYNPYGSGIYSTPNARYVRPQSAYSRPYGGGYGGGYGMPLALGGGLMGGLLLGDMLGGGMGMGGMGMGMGGMGGGMGMGGGGM